MIRTFLTTTALATLIASGVFAQDAPATPEAPATEAPATDAPATDAAPTTETAPATEAAPATETAPATDAGATGDAAAATEGEAQTGAGLLAEGYALVDTDNLATHIMGAPVYSSDAADAEHIGDVNDLVVDENGEVVAVVIGVGGFLGIGQKLVAVDYAELEWMIADDNTERFVLNTTRETLEAAPEFQGRDDDPAAGADAGANAVAPGAATTGAVPGAEADPMAPAASGDAMAPDNAMGGVDTQSMQPVDAANLTAEDLTGTNVYGPGDEHIGTIGDLVLGTDDSIDAVLIDFGGFLGIGVKQVAVAYENLQFLADENDNLVLTLNMTREQMEQAPEYNADTYEAERDTQRVVVQ